MCISYRSALDEAGGEDTLKDLHGSEDDFILQSSEEEDEEEDVNNTIDRITEPESREVMDRNGVYNDAHEPEALNKSGSEPHHGMDKNSQMVAGPKRTETQSSRIREMEGEGVQSLIREYMVKILFEQNVLLQVLVL